jgi:ketosteroid isomerase-like protein
MSKENVEIVQQNLEAFNRRDLPTLLSLNGSDVEIDWSRSQSPFKGIYRGHREMETFFDVFWTTFEEVQLEPHDFTEAGSEVVVLNTAHMRGRDGIEVSARTALVYTVENGQITCLRLFDEEDEALEAVGLSE